MKKRTVISLILAIICAVATNQFWLTFVPVNVNFDIIGNGNYKISAVLNKKNDNKFVRTKKGSAEIELTNQKQNVNITVKKSKHHKRVKLIFSKHNVKNSNIIISDINLKNGKLKLDNLKCFKTKNAEIKIDDNKIVLIPSNSSFQLIYDKPIKICADVKIDFYLLISLVILTFLLSYKLTSYMADFKNLKNQSRIEIIFLAIFVVFLFIPMSHINKEIATKGENRYLAKFIPLIENNKINYDFGKNFNEWFSDRFTFRNALIQTNKIISYAINQNCLNTKNTIFYKKLNLIMAKVDDGLDKKVVTQKTIEKIYKNTEWIKQYCKKNNIKLYILVVPPRAMFFDDITNNIFLNEKKTYISLDDKFIYPQKEMLDANKETPVYFKTDGHWTKKGAYVCYNRLMQEIKKDFPNVKILNEKELEPYYDNMVQAHWNQDLNYGDYFKYTGIPDFIAKKYMKTNYLYYKNPNKNKLKVGTFTYLEGLTGSDEEFYYPDGSDLRVMLIANSFGRNLVEFLPYSFKHTIRLYDNYRNLDFNIYEPMIKKYKPDILILNFNINYITKLQNLNKKG